LVSDAEVIAAAAIKWFRRLITEYKGPSEKLRDYLLKELDRLEKKADEIISGAFGELMGS